MSTEPNCEKMYTYIRGYANGRNMTQTLNALPFAREMHKDQKRKSGQPYFVHPLSMACNALAMGLNDDNLIAAILLHDVCEDCGVKVEDLPVNDAVKHTVALLTFNVMDGCDKETALHRYYNKIAESRDAMLVKLIDQCHNVSTMAGTFTMKKIINYIEETRKYVLPLYRQAKELYPEDSNALYVLKYHIISVIDSLEAAIEVLKKKR